MALSNVKKGDIKMKKLLLILIATFFSFPCFSQIASPSLDPVKANKLPSLASWRYFSTIAGSYLSGSEEKKSSTYEENGPGTGAAALLAFNINGLGLEGSYRTIKYDIEGEDAVQKHDLDLAFTNSALYLSYLLFDNFSIGLGQKLYMLDADNFTFDNATETKSFVTLLSLNVALAEIVFIGFGLGEGKDTGHLEDSSGPIDADYVEVKYQETYAGIGMLSGNPGDLQFKLEVGMISSPEKTESASGSKLKNVHQKTDQTDIIVEVKAGNYFAGYTSSKKTKAELKFESSTYKKEISDSSIISLGYAVEEGLTLSVWYENETLDRDPSTGDDVNKFRIVRLNIGYNF